MPHGPADTFDRPEALALEVRSAIAGLSESRQARIVRHFHEKQKPIFTICHGVQILIAVDGVVRGKKVGALGACEPEVTLAGGTYIDLSPTEAYVDGAMVSAKGWTVLAAFMRECLKVLGTEIYHN
jgi:protease I